MIALIFMATATPTVCFCACAGNVHQPWRFCIWEITSQDPQSLWPGLSVKYFILALDYWFQENLGKDMLVFMGWKTKQSMHRKHVHKAYWVVSAWLISENETQKPPNDNILLLVSVCASIMPLPYILWVCKVRASGSVPVFSTGLLLVLREVRMKKSPN